MLSCWINHNNNVTLVKIELFIFAIIFSYLISPPPLDMHSYSIVWLLNLYAVLHTFYEYVHSLVLKVNFACTSMKLLTLSTFLDACSIIIWINSFLCVSVSLSVIIFILNKKSYFLFFFYNKFPTNKTYAMTDNRNWNLELNV